MKTVKSVSDLKQMALRSGASVSMGTARFNSTNDKVTTLPRAAPKEVVPEPKREPVPVAAAPTKVEVDMAPVASAIAQLQQIQSTLVQSIAQQMSEMKPGQPVLEWDFSIVRNPDGTLASIRAKAVR
jgi:hypothetical protein